MKNKKSNGARKSPAQDPGARSGPRSKASVAKTTRAPASTAPAKVSTERPAPASKLPRSIADRVPPTTRAGKDAVAPRSSRDTARSPVSVKSGLEQALALFAARVGNELNNPLAAVLAANQYLRRRLEGEALVERDVRIRSFMDIIDAELKAATRIVEDLKAFGTPSPVLRSCFLMRDVVDETIRSLRRLSNVEYVNRFPDAALPVNLDREKCTRILTQLILNGADAIPLGRNGTVVVDGRVDNKEVIVVVRDDGSGIGADVLARIHEPLFSTKAKGTGLGLAIADSLVRAQGGTLSCASSDKGTTMTVTLPNG